MDLSGLGSTLPPGLADAERDMGDKFRAAALSITNLYKSSLSYTKQAYNVGYSAALADVLSTVQSSIGAGQNAEQTLSRLMDWADARQAAISAFAAEDADDAPPPLTKRPSALVRPGLNHLAAPNRPASAPVTSQTAYLHANDEQVSTMNGNKEDKVIDGRRSPGPMGSSSRTGVMSESGAATGSTVNSTPNTSLDSINAGGYQATPAGIMSSSPAASPCINRQILAPAPLKPSKGLPMRYSSAQRGESSSSASASASTSASTSAYTSNSMPTSNFNPSIPSAGVPFVSFTSPEASNQEGPAQNYSTGSKRPMLDNSSMDLDPTPSTTNPNGVTVQPSTPVPLSVSQTRSGGRSAKRRSLGNNVGSKSEDGGDVDGMGSGNGKDKERDRGERRRGGRRHGHGAGAGSGAV